MRSEAGAAATGRRNGQGDISGSSLGRKFARQESTRGEGGNGTCRGAEWDWKAFAIFQ